MDALPQGWPLVVTLVVIDGPLLNRHGLTQSHHWQIEFLDLNVARSAQNMLTTDPQSSNTQYYRSGISKQYFNILDLLQHRIAGFTDSLPLATRGNYV